MTKTHALEKLIHVIDEAAIPLSPSEERFTPLLNQIGDAHFVLIGEASHGTEEFYQTRIALTKQLIEKKGFMAIAIEGDWPDAYQIHRYVQGLIPKENWQQALKSFERFPTWMWRNSTMPSFLQWLRDYNDKVQNPTDKIGFYGLDLYSMYSSMQHVINYLLEVDPEAAERAKARYACFDHNAITDPQTYGYLTSAGIKESCIHQAVTQLIELQHHGWEYIRKDGLAAAEEYFSATQNARLVKNAEHYYRSMFEGHVESWNVRDQHMAETLDILANHLTDRFNKPAKIVVWAHNSHVGDARATEMGDQGEVNIGQLTRERHDRDTYIIGFSTYTGSVTAASQWDNPPETKLVNPGIQGSYEELFHHGQHRNFLLNFRNNETLEHFLQLPRLQRAIGVIYLPTSERMSHYFFTRLPYQFDSLIHFDKTTALKPL